MLKLIDPFSESENKKIETTAQLSSISGNEMILSTVNGVLCYVNVDDRLCMPVKDDEPVV